VIRQCIAKYSSHITDYGCVLWLRVERPRGITKVRNWLGPPFSIAVVPLVFWYGINELTNSLTNGITFSLHFLVMFQSTRAKTTYR